MTVVPSSPPSVDGVYTSVQTSVPVAETQVMLGNENELVVKSEALTEKPVSVHVSVPCSVPNISLQVIVSVVVNHVIESGVLSVEVVLEMPSLMPDVYQESVGVVSGIVGS